jgi:hypothetical protein
MGKSKQMTWSVYQHWDLLKMCVVLIPRDHTVMIDNLF